jgi:His-Xaa-Ser system protein (TIGR03982 family)
MLKYLDDIFKVVAVIYILFWLIKEVLFPVSVALTYSYSFMKKVKECDTAMEADWYYSQSAYFDKRANEVQMLSCHEYDKIRKVMLFSGLSENYLSWLGLKTLEIYQRPVSEFTELHKFIER